MVEHLNAPGEKLGLVKVRLYRPFDAEALLAAIPASAKKGHRARPHQGAGLLGEPLYLDVCTAYLERGGAIPKLFAGRYGLGSKEFRPVHVQERLRQHERLPRQAPLHRRHRRRRHRHLAAGRRHLSTTPEGTIQCRFWGMGADGTVGANKAAIKIIGDNTDLYVQAYFSYDSKKSGGITVSHLRFGKSPIQSTYLVDAADFISCQQAPYVQVYDVLEGIKDGGIFLLNSPGTRVEELEANLPAAMRRTIAGEEDQVLQHRRHQHRHRGGAGRAHQHDHADRLLQALRRAPLRAGGGAPQGLDPQGVRQKGRQDRAR